MPSKYDSFWLKFFKEQRGIEQILQESKSKGRSEYEIEEIKQHGNRQNWSGKVILSEEGIDKRGEMAHVRALKNLVPEKIPAGEKYSFMVSQRGNRLQLIVEPLIEKKEAFVHSRFESYEVPEKESESLWLHSLVENLKFHTNYSRNIPENGVYFFYEKGERCKDGRPRIVRVGTHRKQDRFRGRIYNHYRGNRKGSVYRKHLGYALMGREGIEEKNREDWYEEVGSFSEWEEKVTSYLEKNLKYSAISVQNQKDRLRLEKLCIRTLSYCNSCAPSKEWLGKYAKEPIPSAGIWNIRGVPTESEKRALTPHERRFLERHFTAGKMEPPASMPESRSNVGDMGIRFSGKNRADQVEVLFMVACSGSKSSGGRGFPFSNLKPGDYTFPSLHMVREKLVEHYSELPKEGAEKFYKSGRSPRKAYQAWVRNKNLSEKPTMEAYRRYSGFLYDHLDWSPGLESKCSGNALLIMSAMFGIIGPLDPLPNYELIITDRTLLDCSAKILWKRALSLESFQEELTSNFPNVRYLYLLMPGNYCKASHPLTGLFESYHVRVLNGGRQKSPQTWGKVARRALSECAVTPQDMKRILRDYDSILERA